MILVSVFLSMLNHMEIHLVQKIERKTVTTITSHSMWKEMEIWFSQCGGHETRPDRGLWTIHPGPNNLHRGIPVSRAPLKPLGTILPVIFEGFPGGSLNGGPHDRRERHAVVLSWRIFTHDWVEEFVVWRSRDKWNPDDKWQLVRPKIAHHIPPDWELLHNRPRDWVSLSVPSGSNWGHSWNSSNIIAQWYRGVLSRLSLCRRHEALGKPMWIFSIGGTTLEYNKFLFISSNCRILSIFFPIIIDNIPFALEPNEIQVGSNSKVKLSAQSCWVVVDGNLFRWVNLHFARGKKILFSPAVRCWLVKKYLSRSGYPCILPRIRDHFLGDHFQGDHFSRWKTW